jgi:hypothetical protein
MKLTAIRSLPVLLAAAAALAHAGGAAAQDVLTVEDFDDLSDWTTDGFADAALEDAVRFQGLHSASVTFRTGDTWASLTRTFPAPQDWRPFRGLRIEVYPTAPTLDGVFSPTVKVMTPSGVLLEERRGGLMQGQWNTITVDLAGPSAADLAQVSAVELYLADVVNPGAATFYVDYLRLVAFDGPAAGCRTELIFTSNAVMALDYGALEAPSVPVRYRTRYAGGTGEAEMQLAEEEGVRYYYTAASSDYPQFDGMTLYRDEASEVIPALDRPMCVGLYLHEVVAYLSGSAGWDWPAAVGAVDWDFLDRIVRAADARGKRVIWSDPAHAWQAVAGDPEAAGWIESWGEAIVIMFATNFPDLIWVSREYAYALAGRLGIEMGDSVQAWYFDDLGLPYDRAATVWLFALGYGSGARTFQLEGAMGAFDPAAPFMQGVTDFVAMARDPACVTDIEITDVGAVDVTETQATIRWTTNVPADSRVEYGSGPVYDGVTPLDPAYTTSHSMDLAELTPSTLFNFRVRSVDPDASSALSGNLTFTTAGGAGEDDASDGSEQVEEDMDASGENPEPPEADMEADMEADGFPDRADEAEEPVAAGGGCSC